MKAVLNLKENITLSYKGVIKNMVKIKLNNFAYRYDVYHIFKLFYNLSNIEFVEEDYDYKVHKEEDKVIIYDSENSNNVFNVKGNVKFKDELRRIIFKYLRDKTRKELPWGSLIGIRPTKRVHRMIQEGLKEEEIIRSLMENFFVRRDKAKLSIEVAKAEQKMVNKDTNTISIYVAMPFCPTRCLYCSFASNPIKSCKKMVKPYLEALSYEIHKIKEFIDCKGLKVECVYFGGGTPTAIDDDEFHSTLELIYESFVKSRNVKEFNVECGRPDSITEAKLKSMKHFNVNRISINPQTMNDSTLKAIGRSHSVQEVIDKFNLARKMGFDNINMDIIIGLPNENLEHVNNTCEEILKLNPDSITVHGMSVKRASILHEQIVTGKVKVMEQTELNEMYSKTVELAEKLNMIPYYMYRQKNMVGNMENVGYSKPNKEGIYNVEMIEERQTIIALGADAVTKVIFLDIDKIERMGNIKDVREYVDRIEEKVESKLQLLKTLY